jgi:hypothetical protein
MVWEDRFRSALERETLGPSRRQLLSCVWRLSVIAIPDDSRSHIGGAKTEDIWTLVADAVPSGKYCLCFTGPPRSIWRNVRNSPSIDRNADMSFIHFLLFFFLLLLSISFQIAVKINTSTPELPDTRVLTAYCILIVSLSCPIPDRGLPHSVNQRLASVRKVIRSPGLQERNVSSKFYIIWFGIRVVVRCAYAILYPFNLSSGISSLLIFCYCLLTVT